MLRHSGHIPTPNYHTSFRSHWLSSITSILHSEDTLMGISAAKPTILQLISLSTPLHFATWQRELHVHTRADTQPRHDYVLLNVAQH